MKRSDFLKQNPEEVASRYLHDAMFEPVEQGLVEKVGAVDDRTGQKPVVDAAPVVADLTPEVQREWRQAITKLESKMGEGRAREAAETYPEFTAEQESEAKQVFGELSSDAVDVTIKVNALIIPTPQDLYFLRKKVYATYAIAFAEGKDAAAAVRKEMGKLRAMFKITQEDEDRMIWDAIAKLDAELT
jgi:hypothetical protein